MHFTKYQVGSKSSGSQNITYNSAVSTTTEALQTMFENMVDIDEHSLAHLSTGTYCNFPNVEGVGMFHPLALGCTVGPEIKLRFSLPLVFLTQTRIPLPLLIVLIFKQRDQVPEHPTP